MATLGVVVGVNVGVNVGVATTAGAGKDSWATAGTGSGTGAGPGTTGRVVKGLSLSSFFSFSISNFGLFSVFSKITGAGSAGAMVGVVFAV